MLNRPILISSIALLLLSGSLVLSSFDDARASVRKPFKVVIDPGHGGSDHGATVRIGGREITEKDLTLLLALAAKQALTKRGYQVFLTRTRDQDVPLSLRTALANRLKADLFISIHMNSHKTPRPGDARGVETYIVNTTSNEMSRRLAYLENTTNRPNLPEIKIQTDDGRRMSADGQEDVALILKDLTIGANLSESKRLACLLQSQLVAASAPTGHSPASANRGVKQALFHVLLGADMPSALVEAGFINHPQDRSHVVYDRERARLADGIASAVDLFRTQKDTRLAAISLSTCQVR